MPSDRDASKWKPIFHRYLPDIPSQGEETKYGIYSPDVCEVVWPVDRIRIEADTCHRVGWYEIDAVQMRGGVVAPINILNTTAQLHYITAPRFTGNVTFALTATDCYGSFAATSEPRNINIQVLEPPFTRTFTAKEGWVPVDVSQTTPAYTGSRASNVQVPPSVCVPLCPFSASLQLHPIPAFCRPPGRTPHSRTPVPCLSMPLFPSLPNPEPHLPGRPQKGCRGRKACALARGLAAVLFALWSNETKIHRLGTMAFGPLCHLVSCNFRPSPAQTHMAARTGGMGRLPQCGLSAQPKT